MLVIALGTLFSLCLTILYQGEGEQVSMGSVWRGTSKHGISVKGNK